MSRDDELFFGAALLESFEKGVLAGGCNQVAGVNQKDGLAFGGRTKFGSVNEKFDRRQTDGVVFRSDLADEVLEVVFVSEIAIDLGLTI